mmetsp:Transcript_49415/g.139446  ORF Transcript_49415/g.139446 Transcript_49415/m.139446 type:complete len:255 (-) Transcript_49415:355-1119(-)
MRKERSCACRSEKGFQSGSKMTTTEAAVRFKPMPPARVEMRNIPRCGEVLNSSTRRCRCPSGVPPSSRRTCGDQPCCQRQASRMSRSRVPLEKMRTFWPLLRQWRSNASKTCILPHASGAPSCSRLAIRRCVQRLWSMPLKAMSHSALIMACCASSAESFGGMTSGFSCSMWFVQRCSTVMRDRLRHFGGHRPLQLHSSAAAHSSSRPFCSACRRWMWRQTGPVPQKQGRPAPHTQSSRLPSASWKSGLASRFW